MRMALGFLATETVSFASDSGELTAFENIVFGCGHKNTGGFNPREMGLIGLGGRELSLVSQVTSQLGSKYFSTCLVPFGTDPSITSKLKFGLEAKIPHNDPSVVSTNFTSKPDPTYRYVTLEGISVGDKFVAYTKVNNVTSAGNMFIDTGVPPMLIPKDFYNRLETEVKNTIRLPPYQDRSLGTQLCYQSSTLDHINAPLLISQFKGGVKVPLVATSTFISPKQGVYCFAMVPIDSDVGIFGNFAQSNLLISYDLDNQIVSFKQVDCTKH